MGADEELEATNTLRWLYEDTSHIIQLPLRRVRALALRATGCAGSVTEETIYEMGKRNQNIRRSITSCPN
jgi:hypothetical protein